MTDVIVVGAGISGSSTAYELATRGLDVILLDRYGPAAMASGWSLAGVRQSGRHPAELPLAKAAVDLWTDLSARLDGDTHYVRKGNLRLARTPGEVEVIRTMVADQKAAGLDLTFLDDIKDIRAIAPAVAENILAASFCPTDGQADPAGSTQAFAAAAERAGATLRFGERALEILTQDGKVTGLRTDKGVIDAPRIVLAAGIFGNELLNPLGMNIPLDVAMVTVMQSPPTERLLEQVIGVANADCAGRQEWNGRWRVTSGALRWHGELAETPWPKVNPSAKSIWETVQNFGTVIPAFRDAKIEGIWTGLLDVTPDALPVLDNRAKVEGLTIGMGFSGHGFCLGPITGRILSALALGEDPGLPLQPFNLARFDGWNGPYEGLTLHG